MSSKFTKFTTYNLCYIFLATRTTQERQKVKMSHQMGFNILKDYDPIQQLP